MITPYDQFNYSALKLPSLDEMLKVPTMLKAEEDKAQEGFLSQQAMLASVKNNLIPGVDDEAIKAVNQEEQLIKQSVDELSTNGITQSARRNLLNAKQNYLSNISPIDKALQARENVAQTYSKLKVSDPTIEFNSPYTLSVNEIINNPDILNNLGAVSGAKIFDFAQKTFSDVSKYIRQVAPQVLSSGIPYQYITAVMSGATIDDVELAQQILNSDKDMTAYEANEVTELLVNTAKTLIDSTGIDQYFGNDPIAYNKLLGFVYSGMNSALGSKQFGSITDNSGSKNHSDTPTSRTFEDLLNMDWSSRVTLYPNEEFTVSTKEAKTIEKEMRKWQDELKQGNKTHQKEYNKAVEKYNKILIENQIYSPNLVDTQNITDRMLTGLASPKKGWTFKEINRDSGSIRKKSIDVDKVTPYLNNSTKYIYQPSIGLIATGINSDTTKGDTKSFVVPPSVFGTVYSNLWNEAQNYITKVSNNKSLSEEEKAQLTGQIYRVIAGSLVEETNAIIKRTPGSGKNDD